jgi:hypothetical protein
VGVTNDTDRNQLKEISSPPQEEDVTWWNAPDFNALDSFLRALLKTTCKETCESIKITDCFLDMVFIVDSSSTISEADPASGSYSNWELILTFITNIIKKFLIGPTETRIGLIVYGSDARLEFTLRTYDTETELIDRVKTVAYLGGDSNTAAALTLAVDGEYCPKHLKDSDSFSVYRDFC